MKFGLNFPIRTLRLSGALLIASLILAACSFPWKAASLPAAASPAVATATPDVTQTQLPVAPGDSPSSTTTPGPGQTPGAAAQYTFQEVDPAAPTPFPTHPAVPAGVINWLVLGSDARPSEGFHTDVIMLVSIHTATGKVSVVSFPRDLYVNIPGWTTNRINTALPHGGFQMLQDTFDYNFGIRPSGYVMTDFSGFQGLIDSLGGVDVQVGKPLSDHCDLPKQASLKPVNGFCNISPGTHHLDGASALWYVRARYSTSDFDRLRRAQEVTAAIFAKIMQGGAVAHLPALLAQYQGSIKTNLTLNDLLPLVPLATRAAANPGLVARYTIQPPAVKGFINRDKADVQLPDFAAIQQILNLAVFNEAGSGS